MPQQRPNSGKQTAMRTKGRPYLHGEHEVGGEEKVGVVHSELSPLELQTDKVELRADELVQRAGGCLLRSAEEAIGRRVTRKRGSSVLRPCRHGYGVEGPGLGWRLPSSLQVFFASERELPLYSSSNSSENGVSVEHKTPQYDCTLGIPREHTEHRTHSTPEYHAHHIAPGKAECSQLVLSPAVQYYRFQRRRAQDETRQQMRRCRVQTQWDS